MNNNIVTFGVHSFPYLIHFPSFNKFNAFSKNSFSSINYFELYLLILPAKSSTLPYK